MLLQGTISSIPYSYSGSAGEGGGIIFQQFDKLIQLIMCLLDPIRGWEGKGKHKITMHQQPTVTPGERELKPHP